MDIGKSFSYVFDDEDWVKKVAIGGVISIIPIVNFMAVGYSLRTLKNVAEGKERPLPEWDEWGDDWVKGLMVTLAGFIYAIPLIALSIIGGVVNSLGYELDAEGFASACAAGVGCLSALWGLAIAVVLPAATARYAMEDDFGTFFKFGEIFRFIGDNLGNYVIAILIALVAQIVAGLGVILCVVGVVFTSFWASLVSAQLLGQVVAEGVPAGTTASTGGETYGELAEGDVTTEEEASSDED